MKAVNRLKDTTPVSVVKKHVSKTLDELIEDVAELEAKLEAMS